jgi:hypothetical protein
MPSEVSVRTYVSWTLVDLVSRKSYLDASPENAEYLNLVFGD